MRQQQQTEKLRQEGIKRKGTEEKQSDRAHILCGIGIEALPTLIPIGFIQV